MTNTSNVLALKPYLEAVERHCRKLSHEELCDIIYHLAQEVPSRERAAFLEKLNIAKTAGAIMADGDVDHELLMRIRNLKAEIAERQTAIEDGSYYDDYDGYDEEVDALSPEQREELETLFAEADHLFLSNELELAGKAYDMLLNLFRSERPDDEEEEEYYLAFSENDLNLNWRETRGRYCRCVYETSLPEARLTRVLSAMDLNARSFESRYVPSEEHQPMLQDVFDARPGQLDGWEEFLQAWQRALSGKTNNRANILLLEAVRWLEGIEGVAAEVRRRRMPVGYLYWLDQLAAAQAWQKVGQIAQEALDNLVEGKFRQQAAEMLSLAGSKTGNAALILKGKREQFLSTPGDETLTLLLAEARPQLVRNEELENVLRFLAAKKPSTELRVKVLLMLGRLQEAFRLVAHAKPLGWSYGDTGIGIFFGGLLTALTHADPQGETILGLVKRYAGTRGWYLPYATPGTEAEKYPIIVQEIVEGVRNLPLDEAKRQDWLAKAQKIGSDRIEAIVSNQHRNAYNRAAEILAALMECLLLNKQQSQARLLLETYRNQKYHRHAAFRREVDLVLKHSKLQQLLSWKV